MTQKITAIFDGSVLRPEGHLDLPPNTRCRVTVESDGDAKSPGDAWAVLDNLAGSLDAPADWSAEHDHYLYGTAKRKK
jgi:hypothetical protein